MLINIWISFLFPIVWLWFEQTYVPQLLLHETQSEQKQSSNSAALFPEHRLLPELKEETLLGCAVPRRDTAVWHSPSIQWRATGDTITATHLPTSLGNQQGWGFGAPWKRIQGFPLGLRCQMGFLLADVDHLYTSSVAVLEEKLEVFRPHLDKALSNLCWLWSWPCFAEELGLGALWASLCSAGPGPPQSAFCYQTILFFISSGRCLLNGSKTFLFLSSQPAIARGCVVISHCIQAFLLLCFYVKSFLVTKERS